MEEKKEVLLSDRVSAFEGETTRTYTPEGYLRVKGRVARSGIQSYYGFEIGDGESPYVRKRVYRPDDVVLSDAACALYEGVDVTLGHPKQFVDAKSYRALSSGVVLGRARRDEANPDFLVCDMLIKDDATIRAIEAGRVGLSVGYSSTLDFTPGTTPGGEDYDARMDSITRVNHVALVDRPRAGFEARVLDAEGGAMKTITIADQSVELEDALAEHIETTIKGLEARADEAEKAVTLKDEELGKLSAQVEDLTKSLEETKSMILTDDDVAELVKTVEAVRADAQALAGESFTCDSVDVNTIMLEALTASGSTIDFTDAEPAFVKGVFTQAVENAKKASEVVMNDSQKAVAEAFAAGEKSAEQSKTADQLYKERAAEAWKGSAR